MNRDAYLNTNQTCTITELIQVTFEQDFNCTSVL